MLNCKTEWEMGEEKKSIPYFAVFQSFLQLTAKEKKKKNPLLKYESPKKKNKKDSDSSNDTLYTHRNPLKKDIYKVRQL